MPNSLTLPLLALLASISLGQGHDELRSNLRRPTLKQHGRRMDSSDGPTTAFTILSANMGAYPDSPHPETPEGEVMLVFNPENVISILLLGVDGIAVDCTKKNNVTNGCGVHIHAGTTCSNATEVLGHYWNETESEEDPWVDARYASDEDGSSMSQLIVSQGNGFDPSENAGHALVLHEKDGSRIACGLLQQLNNF